MRLLYSTPDLLLLLHNKTHISNLVTDDNIDADIDEPVDFSYCYYHTHHDIQLCSLSQSYHH